MNAVDSLIEKEGANLRPTTFKAIIGMRPLHIFRSKVSLSGNIRNASDIRKRAIAMANCVHRKNKGVVVLFRTHLLLFSKDLGYKFLHD